MDQHQRELQRRAAGGDPLAAARALLQRVHSGSLNRPRLELAAYLGEPSATQAVQLLGLTVDVPADPEDWSRALGGRSPATDVRLAMAALRPCLPALRCWLPEIAWGQAWEALEAWVETQDPAVAERYEALTQPLAEAPQFEGEVAPAGARDLALPIDPLLDVLVETLPDWADLPDLPPAAPWRDPGHGSRFPTEPCDAQTGLFLLGDLLTGDADTETLEHILESVVREYGGRYGTYLTRWARNCAFPADAIQTGVWRAAYSALNDTIRAEILPWCLGTHSKSTAV